MTPRRSCVALAMCVALNAAVALAIAAQPGTESWLTHWTRGSEARTAGRYDDYVRFAEQALAAGPPRHPHLTYNLARAYSLKGRTAEAVTLLRQLLARGLAVDPETSEDFRAVRSTDHWPELRAGLAAARRPIVRSRTALVLPERDLMPEGMAYDPRHRTFYFGSISKSKIVRVDAQGRRTDFKASREDGLLSVLGMTIDSARRFLWVCSNTRDGAASVYKYHLDSGELLKKYAFEDGGERHQFNDVAVNGRGDVFVTDTLGAAVYQIPAATDLLTLLVKLEDGASPNGLAVSSDGHRLFVAVLAGIVQVDVRARTARALEYSENVVVTGIDGLYLYRDSLVAVQNANPFPDRVVRLFLTGAGQRVSRARVIESNHPLYAVPTTGAVVGSRFYYLANTQLGSLGPGGVVSPAAKLVDIVVLQVGLD